jgi:hypothetical protein
VFRSTAQVNVQEYMLTTENYIIIDDTMLVSIPSIMKPPTKAIVIVLEKPPEIEGKC